MAAKVRRVVRWKSFEWRKIAKEVKRLSSIYPGKPLSFLVIKAQNVLPPERHRTRSSIYQSAAASASSPLEERFLIAQAELFEAEDEEKKKDDEQVFDSAPESGQDRASNIEAPLEQTATVGGLLVGAINLFASELIKACSAEIQSRVREEAGRQAAEVEEKIKSFREEIQKALSGEGIHDVLNQEVSKAITGAMESFKSAAVEQPVPRHNPLPRPTAVATLSKKPSVDVVGILSDQAQVVKKKMGDKFSFRFMTADEAIRASVYSKRVVLMTKFVGHSLQERIKRRGRSEIIFSNGAADSVVKALNKTVEKEITEENAANAETLARGEQ